MRETTLALVAFLFAIVTTVVGCTSSTQLAPLPTPVAQARATRVPSNVPTRIALYVGLGAWQAGLTGLKETFSEVGFTVAETHGSNFDTGAVDVLVVGGGWAPEQRQGFSPSGIETVRKFVAAGGGYVGICAGAYLASKSFRWEGQTYAYPLALFSGVSVGPKAKIAPWPNWAKVRLNRVEGAHPLQGKGTFHALYFGGAAFYPEEPSVMPLLRYPDGTLAAVAFPFGHGRVALLGPHLETRQAVSDLDVAANREYVRALSRWAAKR